MSNLIHGDCIEEIKKLPDNSVDAIITDPPYFFGSIVKRFGDIDSAEAQWGNDGSFNRLSKGFMGKQWDGFSDLYEFQVFSKKWAKECLRVLKPGGYLLSFGGTRTYHRMACGIEDAGFEIRDCIMWLYGSGFPKSLNIGKQIDKIQGNKREVIGESRNGSNSLMGGLSGNKTETIQSVTKGNSEWEGWGTALKPAVEPIVVARKPLSEKNVALNVLKWGTGGINIDESRIPYLNKDDMETRENLHRENNIIDGKVFGGGKYSQPREDGRFPANLILECTCDRLEEGKAKGSQGHWSKTKTTGFGEFGNGKSEYFGVGEKDDMKCVVHTDPNCPCYMLDEQAGNKGAFAPVKSGQKSWGGEIYHKFETSGDDGKTFYGDGLGGASRFFYCAKASKRERNNGCEEYNEVVDCDRNPECYSADVPFNRSSNPKKNNHPTVKPVALMEYLIKLVTRENAIVLDPFLGSGTTAIACLKLNRRFIGIEKEPEYIKIAQARIKPYLEQRKLLLEEKQDEN